MSFLFDIVLLLIYLLIYREVKGERKRRRETSIGASCSGPTRDGTSNPGICPNWESNQKPFSSQYHSQPTEPRRSGPHCSLFSDFLENVFLFVCVFTYLFLLLAFTGFRGSATLQCLFYKYVLHLETMLSVDFVYIGILNFWKLDYNWFFKYINRLKPFFFLCFALVIINEQLDFGYLEL